MRTKEREEGEGQNRLRTTDRSLYSSASLPPPYVSIAKKASLHQCILLQREPILESAVSRKASRYLEKQGAGIDSLVGMTYLSFNARAVANTCAPTLQNPYTVS